LEGGDRRIMSLRLAWATQQDPISKYKNRKKKKRERQGLNI
jgi:hypothetical protein